MLKTFSLFNLLSLLVMAMLGACNSNSATSIDEKDRISQMQQSKDVDSNFIDFIDIFSTDTSFQLSRIKFPLKIKRYIHESGRDTIIYMDIADYEMMDFRRHAPEIRNRQSERSIFIGSGNSTARIELRGIENGLKVDYYFERIDGFWILMEIHDSST